MKNVLITGATGNLGKATIETFLAKGHQPIAIVSPGKSSRFDNTKADIVEANLNNEKETRAAIDALIVKYKTIDAALLLAGAFAPGKIEDTDSASIRKMIDVNFETAYHVARPVFLHMQQQPTGGRIILVGARPALLPAAGKGLIAYALSKSLLFKLAELLNAESENKNVVTSVIVPSTIDTAVNRQAMPKADFSHWVKPEEIAEVMEFLSSDKGNSLREPIVKVYGNS